MSPAQVTTFLHMVDAVFYFRLCINCTREIDLRKDKYFSFGADFYQHEKCAPPPIFYT